MHDVEFLDQYKVDGLTGSLKSFALWTTWKAIGLISSSDKETDTAVDGKEFCWKALQKFFQDKLYFPKLTGM